MTDRTVTSQDSSNQEKSQKLSFIVAAVGLIGTLGGTLLGAFTTNYFARHAEFEKTHTHQAIKTYSEVLEATFGESPYTEISLYAHPDVVAKLAEFKDFSADDGGISFEHQGAKDAGISLFLAMRKHVTGTDDDSSALRESIDRLHFRSADKLSADGRL